MTERTKKFSVDLDRLIELGEKLMIALQHEVMPKETRLSIESWLKGDKALVEKYIADLPDFRISYQAWYTEAQAVIKQVIPDRLPDFLSYFDIPKGRKNVDSQNYMIRDYLQGLSLSRDYGRVIVVDGKAALPEFAQQLSMIKAAKSLIDSSLMDMKAVLQADLFDSEIESAKALAKSGWHRAAGAICGVVLEKHLHHVCDIHNVRVAKKNPGISDLSQLLRDANITTVAQWRYIQSLADIRNICDHAKGREPTKDEIDELTSGTDKVLKQVF